MRYPRRLRPSLIPALCVLAAFGLTASAGAPTAGPKPAPGTRVIIPGRPGEPATVGTSDTVKAPADTAYTAADVWFVRMMIPHHTQALEMAALAPQRARNPQIAAIAERIKAAQVPEILQFRAWLQARGLTERAPDAGDHDHASMPGMQSPEAMRALANARGEQFDRMFVDMMSAHHEGAIAMAELRLRSDGENMVEKMANAVAFEQSVEIGRLREILGS
ncbi:DUF305 domain-containing protein [Allorhizocola rhizosphaerae]|uniref:DUF305 domain-containing protein n=1 Tax=Allorhizocola rhizosphaerae TaxID=1872709 RepID=UPI0013C2D4FD|nr:DUF305 domain-containing protein [Allorhizocola rhizosphaerae]